jgi:hypothetical protein
MGVIRFPTERRLQAAARKQAEAAPAQSAMPAEDLAQAGGEPFAFLSVEIRRLPRTESRIDGEIAGRILNRCVLSCLEILSKEKIPVDLAGTVLRPVVEATFAGPDGVVRAARAAVAIRQAITKVQREVELEFHPFGAITVGAVSESDRGVKLTAGAPEQVAVRFREHAAPGQILLSEEAWRGNEGSLEVNDAAVPVTIPGSEPIPAYSLGDVKPAPQT